MSPDQGMQVQLPRTASFAVVSLSMLLTSVPLQHMELHAGCSHEAPASASSYRCCFQQLTAECPSLAVARSFVALAIRNTNEKSTLSCVTGVADRWGCQRVAADLRGVAEADGLAAAAEMQTLVHTRLHHLAAQAPCERHRRRGCRHRI